MRKLSGFVLFISLVLLASGATSAFGQSSNANPRAFGVGQPKTVSELPPGHFKDALNSLRPEARNRALKKLQEFTFPAEDVGSLRVNVDGHVWYADYFELKPPDAAQPLEAPADPGIGLSIAEDQIFLLHSRPGSSNVLYLDFDGHVITGTQWNNHPTYGTGIDPHPALPFDPSGNDGDDGTPLEADFTSVELARIGEIWHRIAEDFAPFDIDVTTQEPAVFTNTTGRVLFTHDTDANGNAMPSQGAGGVAWINVFGGASYVSGYSPALVYYTNLYSSPAGEAYQGYPTLNAEAGSHEFGHNIGMGHDGAPGVEYYGGHGTGLTSWGPIMGGSYSDNVTQWSKGEYYNANNPEDDLAMIAADLGYVADEDDDTSATANEITVEGSGDILVSNPENDPHNALPDNKGVINDRADVDWWYVDVGAGPLSITVTPAWHAFTRAEHRGANLDVELTLYDGSLTQVDYAEPTDNTLATVSITADAGRYYIAIDGVGYNELGVGLAGDDGYTDYNAMGMYFIEGTVVPQSADSTKPSPDPMTWAVVPASFDANRIDMTATTATDDSGYVEYYFNCTAGGAGCVPSGWQTSPSYSAVGLAPNTSYSWQVRARDGSNNTTGYSTVESAATPDVPPVAPSGLGATAVSVSQVDLAWTDNSDNETGFEVWHSTVGGGDLADYSLETTTGINATSWSDTGLSTNSTHYYIVRAINAEGASSNIGPASATTWDSPPAAPSNLAAVANGAFQVDLTWVDNAGNETAFEVWRSATQSGTYTQVGSNASNDTSFSDTGLSPLTTYWYKVRASNSGGSVVSLFSNEDDATTTDEPPTGPSSLTATAVSAGQIDLLWQDNSDNETGFEIEFSSDGVAWPGTPDVVLGVGATSYSDTTLTGLTSRYYRVRAVGAGGPSAYSNTASDTTFEGCSFSKSYNANFWYQFALACNAAPNNTVAEVFSGHSVQVYRLDAFNQAYVQVNAGDAMQPGVGYFVQFAAPASPFTLNGYKITLADLSLENDDSIGKQNFIGYLGDQVMSWDEMLFYDSGPSKELTLAEVDALKNGSYPCDDVPLGPGSKCLVRRLMKVWNGVTYDSYDGATVGMIGQVSPGEAFWVKAFGPGVLARFPATPAGPAVSENGAGYPAVKPSDERKSTGKGSGKDAQSPARFIRLVATSENGRDRGNVLGQHPGSIDGLDSHDLEAPAPFGGNYLSLSFINPLLGVGEWGFNSDYRSPADTFQGEWAFVVRASEQHPVVTLSWEGKDELLQNAWLLDEQSGELIEVQPGGSYTFTRVWDAHHFSFIVE
jgi:hypothetical protein